MSKLIKNTAAVLILLFISTGAFAQSMDNTPVEMATGLYQSGKIYVVVGVIAIIFIGIAAYLMMLDKKISRIEKEMKNK